MKETPKPEHDLSKYVVEMLRELDDETYEIVRRELMKVLFAEDMRRIDERFGNEMVWR